MKARELTSGGQPAKSARMRDRGNGLRKKSRLAAVQVLGPVFLGSMLGGCISVNAPDKPIVIELNINIRQEVIYRLSADAGNTIEENEDIF
jgi:hypothetical protein